MFVGVSPRDGRVARSIRKLMMIQIVSRDPHQCRVAIKDGEQVTESVIQSASNESWTMIVVVSNHAARDGQIAAERAKKDDQRRPSILQRDQ